MLLKIILVKYIRHIHTYVLNKTFYKNSFVFCLSHCPQTNLYWSLDPAFDIPLIRQTMSSNKFTKISKIDRFSLVFLRNICPLMRKWFPTSAAIQQKCLIAGILYVLLIKCGPFVRKSYTCCILSHIQVDPGRSGLSASVTIEILSYCEHPAQHNVHFLNLITCFVC